MGWDGNHSGERERERESEWVREFKENENDEKKH